MAEFLPLSSSRWTKQSIRRKHKPRKRFPPEVLTDTDVRALMAASSTTSASGIRNRALIALLYRSGLRLSEALDLDPKDVDFHRGGHSCSQWQRGQVQGVRHRRWGIGILKQWVDVQANCGHNGSRPLFCKSSGERATNAYIRRLCPVMARRAGIDKRVHAHGLRHTHAAQLREEGVDIGVISKQLGHSAISTTAHYLDHIAPLAVVTAMNERLWIS